MRNRTQFKARHTVRLVIVGALILSGHGWAASNREVERANALYGAGNYREALEVYERLSEKQPESPELQFNRGAAHFQLGDLAKAREAFEKAGVLAKDERFQARSAYNLGNCAFKEGQDKAAQDPAAAISSLSESMNYYKDALSRDRSIDAAAHNLELAKRTVQELRQQMRQKEQQQQEQKQQEQQKKEESKEALDQLIQEQQQQNEQSEEAARQQQQQQLDPTQPAPTPEQMEAMKQQQEQTREKTEEMAEQMPAPDESTPEPEAKSSAKEAAEKQKEAEEHLKNQDAEAANQAQEEALEKLKEARKALDEEKQEAQQPTQPESAKNNQGDKKQEPQQKADEPQEKPGDDEKPEDATKADAQDDGTPPPDGTAKDILNREKQDKEQRRLKNMIGIAPVEKDW